MKARDGSSFGMDLFQNNRLDWTLSFDPSDLTPTGRLTTKGLAWPGLSRENGGINIFM